MQSNEMAMTPAEAMLELKLLDQGASKLSKVDWITIMTNRGVPQEIVTALDDLWETTKKVGGKVIQIGKIILMHILEFLEKHSDFFLGIPIGAKIGIAISVFINLVPFIGPFLQPILAPFFAIAGGLATFSLFKSTGLGKELFTLANDIFKTLAAIVTSLVGLFTEAGSV